MITCAIDRRTMLRASFLCRAGLEVLDTGFLRHLPSVTAAEAVVDPEMVRFGPQRAV
jgi:hypothetical protein